MSDFLRSTYALLTLVVCVISTLTPSLRAQAFDLETREVQLVSFGISVQRSVALITSDPAFDPFKITVTNNATQWLRSSISTDGRSLDLRGEYGNGQDSTATVTLKSLTHTVTVKVQRVCFITGRLPKVLLSADKTRLFALYRETIVCFDTRTGRLLFNRLLTTAPGAEFSATASRYLSFSSDEKEIHILYPDYAGLFRLSTQDLRLIQILPLPSHNTYIVSRRLIGERAGKLYLVRYRSPFTSGNESFPPSAIDVISLTTGKLVQTYELAFHPPPGIPPDPDPFWHWSAIDDAVLHPERPELWVRQRCIGSPRSDGISPSFLRPLTLDAEGYITGPKGEPLAVDSSRLITNSTLDLSSRFLFDPGSQIAVSHQQLFGDDASSPRILGPLPRAFFFLARNGVAATNDYFYQLDTQTAYTSDLLLQPGDGYGGYMTRLEVVGLSADGQDFIALPGAFSNKPPIPALYFLPERIAALPSEKIRTPLDGSVLPSVTTLSWRPLPPPDRYRVYLSTRPEDLAPLSPASSSLLAEPADNNLALTTPLAPGLTYHWRVDAVYGDRLVRGEVQSFSVSRARVASQPYEVATVAGARRRDFDLPVTTSASDTAWELRSDTPWLTIRSGSGVGPGSASLSIDAGSLPAGDHSPSLHLLTADGVVPVPMKIKVLPLNLTSWTPVTGAPRLVALGPIATSNGVEERFLLSIDTDAENIRLCVAVPSTTLPISATIAPPSATTADDPLYVFDSSGRFGEFDLESLDLRRVITLPPIDGHTPYALAARPAPNGRRWMLATNRRMALLDPETNTYERLFVIPAHDTAYLSAEGSSVYTVSQDPSSASSRKVTLRRYDARDQALDMVAENIIPAGFRNHSESPLWNQTPARLAFRGVLYDESLAVAADFEDTLLAVSSETTAVFGRNLLYQGSDYEDVRVAPTYPAAWTRLYVSASSKAVFFGEGQLRFHAVDQFPVLRPVAITVSSISDIYASFGWSQPPATYAGSNQSFQMATQFRVAGSYPEGDQTGFVSTIQLQPETTYEVRARALSDGGLLSNWSEPIRFTTLVGRPTLNYGQWPAPQGFAQGSSVSIPIPIGGKALEWKVHGLPAGLTLNEDTRTIEGVLLEAGPARIVFTASNAAGSVFHYLDLRAYNTESSRPTARYTGLLPSGGGPLSGIWSATRTGSTITGTYRSPLFTRSFKAVFGGSVPAISPIFGTLRRAETRISYVGVPIYLTLFWNLDDDRIELLARTNDLEENFSIATTPETGLASHWSAISRPHPAPARYTALLFPGENSGSDAPYGAGFITLDLDRGGTAKITGETALSQKFTQSLPLSNRHSLPFFYFKDITVAFGGIELTDGISPSRRLIGELVWAKDTNRKASSYREGFEQQLLVFGAPLPTTGKNLPNLAPFANPTNQATLALSGGGLTRLSKPITQTLTPTAVSLVAPKPGTPANPNRVTVKLDPKTGIVTGSAAILNATGTKVTRTQPFRGMFIKDPLGDGEDVVGGYFLLPDAAKLLQSGRLEITEPGSPE